MIIGYASGPFDILHTGHISLLRRASLLYDHVMVGVIHDDILLNAKGHPPVIPLQERLAIVRGVRFVDAQAGDPHEEELDSSATVERRRDHQGRRLAGQHEVRAVAGCSHSRGGAGGDRSLHPAHLEQSSAGTHRGVAPRCCTRPGGRRTAVGIMERIRP